MWRPNKDLISDRPYPNSLGRHYESTKVFSSCNSGFNDCFPNIASGESVDATQELYTLGICNMMGSFVSSMPVTGSFSRSAVNHASGVRTPIGGLYTGMLMETLEN